MEGEHEFRVSFLFWHGRFWNAYPERFERFVILFFTHALVFALLS